MLLVSLTQPYISQGTASSDGSNRTNRTNGSSHASNASANASTTRGVAAIAHLSHLVTWCARWHSLIYVSGGGSGGGGRGLSGAKCSARFMGALNKAVKSRNGKAAGIYAEAGG